jgi:hypothetical protein
MSNRKFFERSRIDLYPLQFWNGHEYEGIKINLQDDGSDSFVGQGLGSS